MGLGVRIQAGIRQKEKRKKENQMTTVTNFNIGAADRIP